MLQDPSRRPRGGQTLSRLLGLLYPRFEQMEDVPDGSTKNAEFKFQAEEQSRQCMLGIFIRLLP